MTDTFDLDSFVASDEKDAAIDEVVVLQLQIESMRSAIGHFRKAFSLRLSVTLFTFLFSWILAFSCAALLLVGPRSPWVVIALAAGFSVCLIGGLLAMSGLQSASDQLDKELRKAEAVFPMASFDEGYSKTQG